MNKIISFSGMSVVAMGLLLGSCVSKSKYMEAQNTIEQYRTDSAAWAGRYNTMQQNMGTLEQKNKEMQTEFERSRTTYMNDQKRWNAYEGYYDQTKKTTEQVHQQIHAALNNTAVPDANVYTAGSKVFVTLPESAFFTANSSKLTVRGKEALSKMASVLKSNPDLEVDVKANLGHSAKDGANMQGMNNKDWNNSNNAQDQMKERTNVTSDTRANIGDSGYVGSGTVTKNNMKDKNQKSTTKNRTTTTTGDDNMPTSGSVTTEDRNPEDGTTQDGNTVRKNQTAKKGTANTSRTRTEQNERDINFRATSANKYKSGTMNNRSENWSLHTARINAIVSELSNNGVASVHMIAPSGNRMVSNSYDNDKSMNDKSMDNKSMNDKSMDHKEMKHDNSMTAAKGGRGYQIVISTNTDKWYDMMDDGKTGTGAGN